MAKGPIVTKAVEAVIAHVYQDHPKWKAPEIQNEVSYLLRTDNPRLPSHWPGLSKVQKVLATVRKQAKELPDDPQAKPWNMATLDDHPIPTEAIPEVLRIWALRMESGISFSIREAKWAARLSAFIFPGSQYARLKISALASKYAQLELIYRLINWPFDSTILDRVLMGVKGPATVDLRGFEPYIPIIATLGGGEEWLEDFIKTLRGGKSK